MPNMRLSDVYRKERVLAGNAESDPESYLLFVHSYFPNNKKKERIANRSYMTRHLPKVVFRYIQKFRQKNVKGL